MCGREVEFCLVQRHKELEGFVLPLGKGGDQRGEGRGEGEGSGGRLWGFAFTVLGLEFQVQGWVEGFSDLVCGD